MLIPQADPSKDLRLPFIGFLPNKVRNHFIAMMGEFVGTFLFLFFAFSATQVANAAAKGADKNGDSGLSQLPNTETLMYISLAFGFSLAVNAWVFFRISGGLFNPAVTLAMGLIGAVGWVRAGLVVIAQLLGAMASAGVVLVLFPGPLNVNVTLNSETSIVRGLFLEMFLTTELVFTILMLAAEKHKATFIAPVGIGLALFIAELTGVFFTGGAVNPARAFGPCVANRSFPGYHWIYWLGPFMGSLVAVGFYRFCKIFEFETANPGQDFDEQEDEAFEFDEEQAATAADIERPEMGLRLGSSMNKLNTIQSQDSRASPGSTSQRRISRENSKSRTTSREPGQNRNFTPARERSSSNRPMGSGERPMRGAARAESSDLRRSVRSSSHR